MSMLDVLIADIVNEPPKEERIARLLQRNLVNEASFSKNMAKKLAKAIGDVMISRIANCLRDLRRE